MSAVAKHQVHDIRCVAAQGHDGQTRQPNEYCCREGNDEVAIDLKDLTLYPSRQVFTIMADLPVCGKDITPRKIGMFSEVCRIIQLADHTI